MVKKKDHKADEASGEQVENGLASLSEIFGPEGS